MMRNGLVDHLVDVITQGTIAGKPHSSHYFRSLPGSGKTLLAKLLAVKLHEKVQDSEVFFVNNSSSFLKFDTKQFNKSMKKLADLGKTAIIVVDEAHYSPTAAMWTELLKPKINNMFVIGFGVPNLTGISEAFTVKHQPPDICYSADDNADMREVVDYWAKEVPDIERDTIAEICNNVCKYTSGQSFAFLNIVELLLTKHAHSAGVEKIRGGELVKGCARYMALDSFYNDPVVVQNVVPRCFRDQVTHLYPQFQSILVPKAAPGLTPASSVEPLKVMLGDLGFWSTKNNNFFSPLLLRVVLKKVKEVTVDLPKVSIKKSLDKREIIERLILQGLSGMTEDNFFEAPLVPRVEDAITYSWAYYISATVVNTSVTPQARGVTGRVDTVCNGDLGGRDGLAVESVCEGNNTATGIKRIDDRCERFKSNYYPWEHNALLNFNMESNMVILPSEKCDYPIDHVYTYVHAARQLYRGRKLVNVEGGVVPRLKSPDKKPEVRFSRFSTFVAREAPRAVGWAVRRLV